MEAETLRWVQAIHVYGMLTWIGSLTGLSFILKQHSKAAEAARADFVALEKGIAMAMDIGATVTMAVGILMLVTLTPSPLKGAGWMHAKLTLAAIIVAIHGVQRVRVGKYKRGEIGSEPAWIIPALELSVIGILVLVFGRPF